MRVCTKSLNSLAMPVCFAWSNSLRVTLLDRPSIAAASLAPKWSRRNWCQASLPCCKLYLIIFVAPCINSEFLTFGQCVLGLDGGQHFCHWCFCFHDLLAPSLRFLLELFGGAFRQRDLSGGCIDTIRHR